MFITFVRSLLYLSAGAGKSYALGPCFDPLAEGNIEKMGDGQQTTGE